MTMEAFLEIPRLNLETVKMFIENHKLTPRTMNRLNRTHSTVPDEFRNITVSSMKLENKSTRLKNGYQRTLIAVINEMGPTRRGKHEGKNHVIELEFTGAKQNISSAVCTKCSAAKESCSAISRFIHFLQHKKREAKRKNPSKKRMIARECRVLLERIDVDSYISKPVLKKLPIQNHPFTPDQLEEARKLSMVHMIREFEGDDADQFLSFCTARMKARLCDQVTLLTIGQADTDLWHELRIGRITASRIREAAHCTLVNGSLMKRIMGVSSGFSFAMKRGTDLEGHVLATLRKEFPGLRNAGLMLNPRCPWMGASPDGICDEFVLEIKCPLTVKTHACYVDVKQLSPKYFAQIQLQMHVTKRKKALLAVAAVDFETTKHVTKVWIDYDKRYVNDVIERAFDYWRDAVFKALLRKRPIKK